MLYSFSDIPEIDPQHIIDMRNNGSAIARGVIPADHCDAITKVSATKKFKRLDLTDENKLPRGIPIESFLVALAVNEAFFQAGITEWQPNLSALLEYDSLPNPHADHEKLKIGVVIAYTATSGSLSMQVADTFEGLRSPQVIEEIVAGDVVFLRSMDPGLQSSKWIADGRTWHNAVGGPRTMQHMAYAL
jgi:hypothetical protein